MRKRFDQEVLCREMISVEGARYQVHGTRRGLRFSERLGWRSVEFPSNLNSSS
jgi:hypothetical protein